MTPYTREELDWLEAEWAYHLHGRSAFLSREDFLQLQAWAQAGVPAEAIVAAMEAYFQRRAKRPRPKAFILLAHLEKDVQKAVKLRSALARADAPEANLEGWEGVKTPLRENPKARTAFEAWRRLQAGAPAPDAPGYLEHFDQERQAFRHLLDEAEGALGPERETLEASLKARLVEARLAPDTLVWKRAWSHHWGNMVCAAWGIPGREGA